MPTGVAVTPDAIPGARLEALDPKLAAEPDYRAGQPVTIKLSPDGKTLLVLTSGFNRLFDADAKPIVEASSDFVFVYDVADNYPRQLQALPLPAAFEGLAWAPDGKRFVVSGGVDDKLYVFRRGEHGFAPEGEPIPLGHTQGVGPGVRPMVAGVAISPDGARALAANYQNDSVSLIDLAQHRVVTEFDLRPGKLDPAQSGMPGGEFPIAVVWGRPDMACIASQRDRELVKLKIDGDKLAVDKRIKLKGEPTALLLDHTARQLYVAEDDSDTVAAFDIDDGDLIQRIPIAAPPSIFANRDGWKGANPNGLALSPDEATLFVANGGLNAIAVVALPRLAATIKEERDEDEDAPTHQGQVVAMLPTGWYPTGVAFSADGRFFYAINSKSNPGANPGGCRNTLGTGADDEKGCHAHNESVWQREKGGLMSAPLPGPEDLARLTRQVATNDRFDADSDRRKADAVMAALRRTVKHVIYIVKENRSYDQVLGDLDRGNGDPSLALLGRAITPNHHALAQTFVTADNFYDTGESSNAGWNWATAGHASDYVEKTAPVNDAQRGLQYDAEGTNRNLAAGYPKLDDRRKIDPRLDDDADILPGIADIAAPDGAGDEPGLRYIWDAALHANLTLRNYGFFPAFIANDVKNPAYLKPSEHPFADKAVQFIAAQARLAPYSDPYFRSVDVTYPDFWRVAEWRREFDAYVKSGKLPALELLRLPSDHFGDFEHAPPGFNTVAGQMGDNDYALGQVVEAVAHSKFADSTVILAVEDDAQDGADHVDSHRSLLIAAGATVKRGATVSDYGNSISVIRTIEDLLGLKPLGLNDGLALPLQQIFDPTLKTPWHYDAIMPEALAPLHLTGAPAPAPAAAKHADAR